MSHQGKSVSAHLVYTCSYKYLQKHHFEKCGEKVPNVLLKNVRKNLPNLRCYKDHLSPRFELFNLRL